MGSTDSFRPLPPGERRVLPAQKKLDYAYRHWTAMSDTPPAWTMEELRVALSRALPGRYARAINIALDVAENVRGEDYRAVHKALRDFMDSGSPEVRKETQEYLESRGFAVYDSEPLGDLLHAAKLQRELEERGL
jgi:hypothetical protein